MAYIYLDETQIKEQGGVSTNIEPPLKLVLIEGEPDQPTVMDHLGVEVETTDDVNQATARLSQLGLFTQVEDDTTCCYALQDKVWVHGPGAEPWEVYTVKADAPDATTVHHPATPAPETAPAADPTRTDATRTDATRTPPAPRRATNAARWGANLAPGPVTDIRLEASRQSAAFPARAHRSRLT